MPIPVLRAETFYRPPPTMPDTAWALVPAAERVLRWWEMAQQRRVAAPVGFIIGQQVYARIDHNRWVADCSCGSAQVVSPTDPRMSCPQCGAGWFALVFPEDVDATEAAVAADVPAERNWRNPNDPVILAQLGIADLDQELTP